MKILSRIALELDWVDNRLSDASGTNPMVGRDTKFRYDGTHICKNTY